MKKLLGLLLVAAIAFPASAAVIKNVELTGEIQTIASSTRHAYTDGYWNDDYNRSAKTRALAGFSFDVVEDVKANLLFQYAYNWGDHNYTNNGFDNAKGMYLANANLVFSNLFGALEATIGRQFYGDENSAVMYFGPNHYNAEGLGYARALDAAKLVYSNDNLTATVIAGKIADMDEIDWDYDNTDPTSIFGADVKFNLTEDLTAQAYIYDWKGENYGEHDWHTDDFSGFYGTKLTFAPEAFTLGAEYARNFGGHRLIKEHKDTGYMVRVDGNVKATDALNVRGLFHYETKAFFAFGNFTPGLLVGHLLKEQLDEYGDGLRMFNLGVDYKPADQWTVSLDGYSFQNRFGSHSATFEFDVTAKYDYNEYVQLFAGLGYVKYSKSEDYYNDYEFDELEKSENTKAQIGMLVRF